MSSVILKLSILLVLYTVINQGLATDQQTSFINKRPSVLNEQQPKQDYVLYRRFNSTNKEAVNLKKESLLRFSTLEHPHKTNPVFKPASIIAKKQNKTKQSSLEKGSNQKGSHLRRGKRQHHGISQIKSIYETLKSGESINNDKTINTIRYVPASKFETNNKLYFLFNLSLLTSTEKVFKSELFINNRYIRQRLSFDLYYFFYSTKLKSGGVESRRKSGGPSMTLDLRNYLASDFGQQNQWESFSILNSIQSYLSMRASVPAVNKTNLYYTFNNNEQLYGYGDKELVLIMEASSLGKQRRRRYLVENLNPYLIIYSTEEEKLMTEFFENRITDKLEAKMIVQPTFVENKNVVSDKEIKELQKFEDQVDQSNNEEESIDMIEGKKTDENSIYLADYLIKKSDQHKAVANHYDEYLANTDRLLYGKINNDRLRKRDLSNEIVFDESKWKLSKENEKDLRNNEFSRCEKKPILIDFIDISFNQWIIEPKRFQSSYCTGSCKFPSNKEVTFSNYATLQSILNSLKFLNSPPPELCCTPSSTSPLPVLYVDSNGRDNVVKLLPDMIVNDCLCH